ncbi:MAG: hypothetical protein KF805_06485 [Phycisphaeraceae bacterium]|nr:hypothetical protein [Phycisphaeraceae bacterium]
MNRPEDIVEPRKAPDESPGAIALRNFLSEGTIPCPSCGYDVRGCDEPVCPECAWPLELQLRSRVSSVPYWVFSLLINGWLFLWGLGGSLTTAMRMWQYHSAASRRFVAAVNSAQAQAIIQQFTGRSDAGASNGTAGGSTVPITPTRFALIENLGTFFLGQNLLDQTAITLFFLSLLLGGLGLLLTPWMRRLPARSNAWLISISVAIFVATMVHYVARYWTYLMQAI